MSVHQPALEALGYHDYLVRFQHDEDTVGVRLRADPAVVVQIADDERRCRAHTIRPQLLASSTHR